MKTIKVYRFSELNEKAQHKAYDGEMIDFSDDYTGDYLATLHAFEKVFDISVYDYRVGNCVYSPYFRYVRGDIAGDAPAGDPIRVAKFVWNNFADDIMKGRFYSTRGEYVNGRYTYKHRHSKVFFEMDGCPLTGFAADCTILQPVIDCLHYKRLFDSFDEMINECLQAFFAEWDSEIEYCNSFEYFREWALENDESWYTESGEHVKGVI